MWTAALMALFSAPVSGQGSENSVDYRISARLDGDTKIITGTETVSWINGSGESVLDAWFHLYLNAFSNNRSTHLTEAKGTLRDHELSEGWGWSRITSVSAVDPATGGRIDLMPSFRYERPDDGNADDRTVFAVDLPAAVEPGGALELQVAWEAQLPRVRRRTGYKDDFLLVAQWFPKLGVYEAERGWNCHQFHMNTEFYSDYGTYDVELNLPAEYKDKVYASGFGAGEIEGGRYVVRFAAPATKDRSRAGAFGKTPVVHDFTWTGDPRFKVHKFTFEPSHWIEEYPDEVAFMVEAIGEEALDLRRVDVTVLVHPERDGQAERHRHATEAALFFYGLWFGEYPYQHVTVVDPPWGGRAAGGMEYPTLFTCGTRLFTTPDMYSPESVTVHEAGHQFWYGLVGNNEFEAAWLDEGFNSYTDSEVLYRVYGPSRDTTSYAAVPVDGVPVASVRPTGALGRMLGIECLPAPFGMPVEPVRASGFLDWWRDQPALTFVSQWNDPRWGDRSGYLGNPDSDAIDTYAYEHVDRSSYRANSYPRTAVALRTLQHVVGDVAFVRGMRNYAQEWRYRHPYADDFFRSFQEGADVDCQWYFDEVFRSTETGDWQVDVEQRRRPSVIGLFQGEGGEFLERTEPDGDDEEAEGPWEIDIALRRVGGLSLPMPVRLTFEDGTTRDEMWTRDEQLATNWKRLLFESESKLVGVQIDPDRRVFLDADLSNNAWYDASDKLAPWRWGERVLGQVQHHLHFLGGIGG